MSKILLTCVLALVCGFGGATAAGVLFHDSMTGVQGPTGLTGATGPAGKNGTDGTDGERGLTGPQGKTGKAGKAGKNGKDATSVSVPTDLSADGDCSGKSVSVITAAKLDKDKHLTLTKKQLCIVTPPTASATAPATASSTADDSAQKG